MLLCFELTMPSVGSWNGVWSGAKDYRAIVRSVSKGVADLVLRKSYYTYDFGDGWVACISVRLVHRSDAAKARKKSTGFAGYDWMVDSILEDQTVTAPSERRARTGEGI